MTNIAQIGHVMMKDVREFRWLLAAYLCVVALATGHALGLRGLDGEGAGYLMILVVVIGMLVAASVVQGDSPTRADAFWAVHPLNPGAVLLAKAALVAIVVIGVPAIGELAGLITYGMPTRDLPAALGASVWEYGRWLLIAMTIGALARDLRAVVIAFVAIPIYFLATVIWSATRTPNFANSEPSRGFTIPAAVWVSAFIVGGAALLWYEYRSRDSRPRTWFAGVAVFLAGIASLGASSASAASADVPAGIPRTTFHLLRGPNRTGNLVDSAEPMRLGTDAPGAETASQIPMRIEADSIPPRQRLSLIDGVAMFHLHDGTVFRHQIERAVVRRFMQSSATPEVKWLGERDATRTSIGISVRMRDSEKQRLDTATKDVSVEARLAVSVPDYADTLPLTIGATAIRNGSRVTIATLGNPAGVPAVTLAIAEILPNIQAAGAGPFNAAESSVSLVNTVRHEAIEMDGQGVGYGTGWLVLPGNPTRTGHGSWGPPLQDRSSFVRGDAGIDDAWLHDARLVITHWAQIGSYPVTVRLSAP